MHKSIIETDNFDGDYPDERFVVQAIPEDAAKQIAEILNRVYGPNSRRYFKLVATDYKLRPGFEP